MKRHKNTMIEPLEVRRMLSAAMVKDINTAQLGIPGLWASVGAGNTVFLSQDDGVAGWELYKTDGTTAGTVLVKDIRPGRDNSQPGWLTHMGGGTIFFAADNGTNGVELWKSDGTTAGTVLVKDINPGVGASAPGSLVNVNGTLYFSATDGVNGTELWKSDGTSAGTVMVKNIATGATGSTPTQLINNNGTLFFRATTVTSGAELWKSNGTDAGTVQVTELYNNNNDGMTNTAMTALNGFVYFAGRTSTGATDPWKSDGTTTTIVRDLPSASVPANFRTSGSRIYFTVSAAGDQGLWTTDGTAAATNVLVGSIIAPTDVNGTLFFGSGTTLYSTTGGAPTTVKTGLTMNTNYWTNVNGTLYLPANAGAGTGEELWKSDGTGPGTVMIKDIEPGTAASNPFGFIAYGPGGASGIIFATVGGVTGGALWKSNGTDAGTVMIKDIYPGTDSSGPLILTAFKGAMYFLAFEPGFGSTGGELYRSDGTETGTGIFVDLFPGPTGGNVTALKAFGDYLYFAGDNGAGAGRELWRTNGTPGNVEFVKDINPGSANASIGGNTVSGNFMYFWATTASEGEELWRTDGTNGGTIRMSNNLAIGTTIGFPTDVNGTLYYTVHNSSGTFTGLWKSDGFGSVGVATSLTSVSSMLNINGTLYISGTTSTNGAELYKIGPGDTSPVLVKDIVVGSSSSSPGNLAAAEGTLFFSATTSANGAELWKSDGTAAGTVLVKDIRLGSTGSSINSMVGANGVAYFRADDGINGGELWRSDGTAAGTYLLKDITPPGATTGNPTRMYAANGFVYFAATDDNSSNYEAWRTDGTPEGTAMLGDYYPEGSFFNNPANAAFFTAVNGEVFYRFADDTHGGELWKADLPDFAVLGAGGVLTISATANNDVIDLSTNGAGGLVVTLNGLTETFAPGAVTSINLVGRIGRDTVNVNSGTIAFSTDGGAATANLTLRVASGASAAFNATQHLAALELDGGLAALAPGHDKLLVVGALSITNNGRLDLADNSLVLDYSSAAASPIGGWNGSAYDGVTGLVQTAHNGGGWDGSGIATSMSDAAVGLTTLGIGEASDVLGISAGETALWNGQTVDASSVIIKYTYSGDANLDGFISGDDYSTIDFYVGTSAFGYYYGDFNFDGIISGDDYSTIDFNYGAQGEPL